MTRDHRPSTTTEAETETLPAPVIANGPAGVCGEFLISGEDIADLSARMLVWERDHAPADDLERFLIRQAATPPKPRQATKVPRSSKRKRLDNKKHRADIKRGRGRPE